MWSTPSGRENSTFTRSRPDDGIEILTGVEAGAAREDGTFEDGTVHFLVDRELQRLARGLKAFSEAEEKGKDGEPPSS